MDAVSDVASYRFGAFEFQPGGKGLTRSKAPVPLEPQAERLLAYLVENRDRVVTRDELIDEIWYGQAITDAALSTRIRTVRRALGDDREQQAYIRTHPRRGFQFVAQVAEGGHTRTQVPRGRPRLRSPLIGVLCLLVAAVLAYIVLTRGDGREAGPPLPDRPSIAVLPLGNLSGDPDDALFVEGITQDLTTHLSRFPDLFVISSATLFSYDTARIDPVQLARELGVGFVARGSLRRDETRLRISVELIDVTRGETIWAEQLDREAADIFALQDDLSQSIAAQLVPEIRVAGASDAASVPTDDLGAWDLYLRGLRHQADYSPGAQAQAIALATQAIERDPAFGAGHSLLARAYGTQFFFGWTDDPQATLGAAVGAANRALELDAGDPEAHAALGYIYRFTGDADRAIDHLERAVALNPNDARIRLELGHTLDWFRLQDRALPQMEQAIRLSPRDPLLQNMYFYKGHILFHLGRHDEALEAARQMSLVVTNDTWRVFQHLLRAANLASLDRPQQAQEAIDAALAINPRLSLAAMTRQFEGSRNHPDNRRIWLEALSRAGLPE